MYTEREDTLKIYLSGPMSGLPEYNFPAFDDAASKLRLAGHIVYNPADIDRALKYDGLEVFGDDERRHIISSDCNFIIYHADAIALLPGWENSRGCTVEVALGIYLELDFYHAELSSQGLLVAMFPTAKPWGIGKELEPALGTYTCGCTVMRSSKVNAFCDTHFKPIMHGTDPCQDRGN